MSLDTERRWERERRVMVVVEGERENLEMGEEAMISSDFMGIFVKLKKPEAIYSVFIDSVFHLTFVLWA